MSCPMYEDHTSGCVENFKEIIQLTKYGFCESDKYEECPFYQLLNGKAKPCEFLNQCQQHFNNLPNKFTEFITDVVDGMNKYCLSDNNVNCEIYKLRNAGKDVPMVLLPNGKIIELKT